MCLWYEILDFTSGIKFQSRQAQTAAGIALRGVPVLCTEMMPSLFRNIRETILNFISASWLRKQKINGVIERDVLLPP
jgi:hypothetical protein